MRILGEGCHERQIDVNMGIDKTREDITVVRIHNFGPGGLIEIPPDASNNLSFDEDVRAIS